MENQMSEAEREWIISGIDNSSKRRYEEAIKCYDNALELNPKNTEALLYKSVTYMSTNEYTKAIECCNKVLEIDPKNKVAQGNKRICCEELHDLIDKGLETVI